MPDHAHLLLWPRSVSLVRILRDLKSKTGFGLAKSRHTRGPIWQHSYFDFICRRARDFGEKLNYIYRNAVAPGLVLPAQDWRGSSEQHNARLVRTPLIPHFME